MHRTGRCEGVRIPLQHCPALAGAAFKARDVLSCPGKDFTCLAFHLHPLEQCLEGVSCPRLLLQNVISLSSDEHLLSYPEKLRLCHGTVTSKECHVWCDILRTKSDSCWRELPGDGGRTMVGMEVTDVYCATLGLRVGCWLFFLDWNKKLQCCSWTKPKAHH